MITQLDFCILNFIRANLANPVLDALMKFITHLGDWGFIWIMTALVLLCFKKTRMAGLCLAISLVVTAVAGNLILKNLFARTRPFIEANIPIIITPPRGYSFPSGHTSSSFAAATALAGYFKKQAVGFYILAVLIAFSRLYLYVHYPSDIAGGAVLGVVIGAICVKTIKK